MSSPHGLPQPVDYQVSPTDDTDGEEYIDVDGLHKAWCEFYKKEKNNWLNQYKQKDKRLVEAERKLALERKTVQEQTLQQVNAPEVFDNAMYTKVHLFAQTFLFRKMKFFTSMAELDDYTIPKSAGDQTMSHFKIPPARKSAWWNCYKSVVTEGANYQRQTAQTGMGKKLKGMSLCFQQCHLYDRSINSQANTHMHSIEGRGTEERGGGRDGPTTHPGTDTRGVEKAATKASRG